MIYIKFKLPIWLFIISYHIFSFNKIIHLIFMFIHNLNSFFYLIVNWNKFIHLRFGINKLYMGFKTYLFHKFKIIKLFIIINSREWLFWVSRYIFLHFLMTIKLFNCKIIFSFNFSRFYNMNARCINTTSSFIFSTFFPSYIYIYFSTFDSSQTQNKKCKQYKWTQNNEYYN